MAEDDDLEEEYQKILPSNSGTEPHRLYCGVVKHVRNSVIVSGSSNADGFDFIAQPLQPLRDLDDPSDAAVLERLRREVVQTTDYVDYEWEPEDD